MSAASGGNSEPKQGQRSQSARAFAPKHDAGTATRHYRAFWQRRCRATAAGAVLPSQGGNCAVLPKVFAVRSCSMILLSHKTAGIVSRFLGKPAKSGKPGSKSANGNCGAWHSARPGDRTTIVEYGMIQFLKAAMQIAHGTMASIVPHKSASCSITYFTIFERFTAPRSTTMIHYYLFFVSKAPALTL